ncbi:MAG: hypothetical protein IPN29_16720 [Saprospiraceae bacterium]|nr:hypothetical protein [Saprospiraceae bacterium]
MDNHPTHFTNKDRGDMYSVSMRRRLSNTFLVLMLTTIQMFVFSNLEGQSCTCNGNLVLNPSFEGSVTNWSSSPAGSFTSGTGFQQCGNNNAFLNATASTSTFWQQVNSISAGSTYDLSFYAGTHLPSYDHQVRIRFYNSSNAVLQTNTKQIDFDVDGQLGNLQYYTITATAPAGTTYLRVEGYANGDYIKIDQVCLTTSCNNVTNGGAIGVNQTSCGSSFDPSVINNVTSPSGGSGTLEYLWLKSTTTCTPPNGTNNSQWVSITNSNSATYDPGVITQTTCFLRCSRRLGCTEYDGESNVVTITLNPGPYPEFSGNLSICNGSSTTLTVIGKNGVSPYVFSWSNGLGTGSSKTVSPTTTTTYTVIVTDANGCTDSGQVTVTVNQCGCINNYILNHSFENGTSNWTKSGGNFTTGTYAAVEGFYAGHFQITNPASNWLSQTVAYPFAPGSVFTLSVYAGTHNPSLNHQVCIDYYDANWNWIDNDCVSVNSMLPTMTQYTVTGTMPANGKYVGVAASGSGDWIKTDVWCLTGPCYQVFSNVTGTNRVCAGGSSTLTAAGSGGVAPYTYAWSNGLGSGASKTVAPATTTTYTITTTDASGCSGTSQVTVTVDPLPVLSAGNDPSICMGQSVTLTVNASNGTPAYTFNWPTPPGGSGASKTVSPTTTTTYVITVTDSKGCTDTDDVSVNVGALPTAAISGPGNICAGGSATLTANGAGANGNYLWSTGATTPSITVSPATNTTYTVTVTSVNGCFDAETKVVTVTPTATVYVGPDLTLCQDDELVINSTVTGIPSCGTPGGSDCNHTLAASGGWLEAPSASTICGDNAGTKLWTQSGQGISFITLDLGSVLPAGTVICSNMKLEHCNNSSSSSSDAKIQASLTSGSGFINLVPSLLFSSQTYHEYCYTLASDARYIKISDNGKCAFRVDYVKYTTPGTYNNMVTYAWSGPGIIGSTTGTSITVNTGGTYTLVVTDCGGCTASDNAVVTINNMVVANAGADVSICNGQSVTLTAATVAGATYEWRENGNATIISSSQSFMVSPTTTKSYILTVRKDGCEDSDDVVITVNPLPEVNAGPDVAICYGFSSTLNAVGSAGTPGYTYVWSNGATTASTTVSPLVTTTYTVTVTDSKGCIKTDAVVVTVNPLPEVNAGPDVAICYGFSSTLTAVGSAGTPGYTYVWSNGATTASTTVSPLVTTTYTVTVTDSKGCIKTDAVVVTVNPLPEVNAGPDVAICYGFSSTLTAVGSAGTPGYTYVWSNGATTASTTVSPLVTTTYTVTVTDTKGCIKTDAVVVTVNPLPEVNAGPDVAICYGFSSTLTAVGSAGTPGYTYVWSNGATTASTTVSPLVTTTYTVTVTDSKGCIKTDAVVVTVNPLPEVNAGPDVAICYGFSSTLTAVGSAGTPGYTYVWSNGATTASTTVSPLVTTTYTVTVTDTKGCIKTDAVVVTVNPLPEVNAGPDVAICYGFSSTLTAVGSAGTPGYTYVWSNGATTASTTVSPLVTTTYTVTVTDSKGCIKTDAVVVTVNPLPEVNAGPDVAICYGFSSTLTAVGSAGTPGYTYVWSNGATTASTTVSPLVTTTYTVTITDSKGCIKTDAVVVTVNPLPEVNAGADVEICYGFSSTLTAVGSAGTPGYTYVWSNGATTASTTVSPLVTTTYTVTVTDTKGCIKTDAVVVTVNPLPEVNAGPDVAICYGFSSTLTAVGSAGTPGYTYVWSNGATTASTTVSPLVTTTYTVTITDSKGCIKTDAVVVTVNPLPEVNAGPDVEICYGFSSTINAVGSGGTPGYTYVWSNGATTASTTVSPLVTTTYTVTITDSKGCIKTDAVVVTVNPLPEVNAGPDVEICYGFSSTINAVGSGGTPGYTYVWSNGATTASTTVSPLVTTTYTVTITDSKGCIKTDAVVVTVNPLPEVNAGLM